MSIARRIWEQHRDLMLQVDRLKVLAAGDTTVLPEHRLRELLSHDVERLRQRLRQHFAFEESSGYLRPVLNRRPEMADQVEGLRQQHQDVLARLLSISESLSKGGDLPAAREGLAAVLQDLADHERKEGELLQVSYTDELGAGD